MATNLPYLVSVAQSGHINPEHAAHHAAVAAQHNKDDLPDALHAEQKPDVKVPETVIDLRQDSSRLEPLTTPRRRPHAGQHSKGADVELHDRPTPRHGS